MSMPTAFVVHCGDNCGGLRHKPGSGPGHNTMCPVRVYQELVTHVAEAIGRFEREGIERPDIALALECAARRNGIELAPAQ